MEPSQIAESLSKSILWSCYGHVPGTFSAKTYGKVVKTGPCRVFQGGSAKPAESSWRPRLPLQFQRFCEAYFKPMSFNECSYNMVIIQFANSQLCYLGHLAMWVSYWIHYSFIILCMSALHLYTIIYLKHPETHHMLNITFFHQNDRPESHQN